MPRVARIVIPSAPRHITQRGNNRQGFFFTCEDRRAYLGFLREAALKSGLDVWGYCLMTNHVHLIVTPHIEDALAKAPSRAHFLYTQHIDTLHGRSGHLWQSRFYSCALDEPHFWAAMRYVEQNPVRTRMTRIPWTHPWSSARVHTGGHDGSGLLRLEAWRAQMDAAAWKEFLLERLDASALEHCRIHTRTGRRATRPHRRAQLRVARRGERRPRHAKAAPLIYRTGRQKPVIVSGFSQIGSPSLDFQFSMRRSRFSD